MASGSPGKRATMPWAMRSSAREIPGPVSYTHLTSGFLNHLTYPNGMVRQNTYHPTLNLVTAIGSVSYTHLDVYKRQRKESPTWTITCWRKTRLPARKEKPS